MTNNPASDNLKPNEKLLPCPFCGSEDVTIKQTSRTSMKIQCRSCAVQLKQSVLKFSLDWLQTNMIKTWNTRTNQSPEEGN